MGGAMSVKDADERFVARTVQLAELREQLAACFATAPETAQMDALLAQARELLEALSADIVKIKNDLGPDYNLGQFQALTHQIEQLVDSVDAIPFIYLYEEMVQRLPTGWKAVKG